MGLRDEVGAVKSRLQRFMDGERVRLPLAQRLVRDSAWWYDHPQGPTPAPKHYERVTEGLYGWEVEFGANRFLVEWAVRRCNIVIGKAIESVVNDAARVNCNSLRSQLALQVRASVANYNDDIYASYDAPGGFMHFGTQAINVNAFVATLCELAEVHRICRESNANA